MWLIIKKPKRFSANWFINWVIPNLYYAKKTTFLPSDIFLYGGLTFFFLIFFYQASIYIGLFIMVASTIGGLRNIITDASTYSFYT